MQDSTEIELVFVTKKKNETEQQSKVKSILLHSHTE